MAIERRDNFFNQETETRLDGPLTYEEIMQRDDVKSATTLQEQDALILGIYRQSREKWEQQNRNNWFSRLRNVVSIFH